ncbi:unnamed protein product [Polarella glacialis]|uniref:Uncharacterized protein n=1 Tax=Polarella glacialis TaxID=89957 RepID=A0A813G910_POLGL|nr:unnamed protein product [Polarella glacialis]CAE8646437.1 unnamed protein product [Polarella glacialis]
MFAVLRIRFQGVDMETSLRADEYEQQDILMPAVATFLMTCHALMPGAHLNESCSSLRKLRAVAESRKHPGREGERGDSAEFGTCREEAQLRIRDLPSVQDRAFTRTPSPTPNPFRVRDTEQHNIFKHSALAILSQVTEELEQGAGPGGGGDGDGDGDQRRCSAPQALIPVAPKKKARFTFTRRSPQDQRSGAASSAEHGVVDEMEPASGSFSSSVPRKGGPIPSLGSTGPGGGGGGGGSCTAPQVPSSSGVSSPLVFPFHSSSRRTESSRLKKTLIEGQVYQAQGKQWVAGEKVEEVRLSAPLPPATAPGEARSYFRRLLPSSANYSARGQPLEF